MSITDIDMFVRERGEVGPLARSAHGIVAQRGGGKGTWEAEIDDSTTRYILNIAQRFCHKTQVLLGSMRAS